MAIALALWWRDRRHGIASALVALLDVAQSLSFALWSAEGLARFVALWAPLPTAALAASARVLILRFNRAPPRAVAGAAAAG